MIYMMSDPQKALALLDSAQAVGTISPLRQMYLQALVAEAMGQIDSSMAICHRAMDDAAWSSELRTQIDIYALMSNLANTMGHPAEVISYTTDGIRVAHELDDCACYEAYLNACAGFALCQMGQGGEGIPLMQQSLAELQQEHNFVGFTMLVNSSCKYMQALYGIGRYQESVVAAQTLQALVDAFLSAPEHYEPIPKTLQTAEARQAYAEHVRLRIALCMFANYSIQEDLSASREWLARVDSLPGSEDATIQRELLLPLARIGENDRVRQSFDRIMSSIPPDTVSTSFIRMLRSLLRVAINEHDDKEGLAISRRMHVLRDSLYVREHRDELIEMAIRYKLQDEQMARRDAESRTRWITIVSVSSLLAVTAFFLGIAAWQWRRKHKAAKRQLGVTTQQLDVTTQQLDVTAQQLDVTAQQLDVTAQQLDEKSLQLDRAKARIGKLQQSIANANAAGERRAETPETLFRRIRLVMEQQRPYTNPDFDINALAMLIFSNRTYTSNAINVVTGMNFRTWLATYRVQKVKEILQRKPDTDIATLCEQCGYNVRLTLSRQFHQLTGMTVTAYVASLRDDT